MGRPAKHPPEFQREAVELVLGSGRSSNEVASVSGSSAARNRSKDPALARTARVAVVAPSVQQVEVRIARRDLTDVVGADELALDVVLVGVKSNGHNAFAEPLRQSVVVVPAASAAIVGVAMRAHPLERNEQRLQLAWAAGQVRGPRQLPVVFP